MMLLTERQKAAEKLSRELHVLEAECVSPLPLREDSRMRIYIREDAKKAVLQQLKDGGWEAYFVSMLPQFYAPVGNMQLVHVYEIDLPPERQPVVGEPIIPHSDLRERPEKSDLEVKGIRKYLGLEK
jgi:hypothetical protein